MDGKSCVVNGVVLGEVNANGEGKELRTKYSPEVILRNGNVVMLFRLKLLLEFRNNIIHCFIIVNLHTYLC
jgi:hypothetical protein